MSTKRGNAVEKPTKGTPTNKRRSYTAKKNMPQTEVELETLDETVDNLNISDDEEGGTRIGDIYIPPPTEPYCSSESKGPRLIIKKIENVNFKSYAGKVVLGPFHHCFTAIIGPNGSGKSNVIDSMLFVFGYRANKIRCKKISTLLHNSAKFPNIQMCSVAVHFRQIIDNADGSCEEIPNSEIVVERTAYIDNTSHYTINGKRSQFKEVAKLLKEHNVDLDHNRFLILQGEVESIAMMKSKGQNDNECGMLEYLEDIVGTTRYKKPLVKIYERVEQLSEERTEKHNRCKLAEREMKDLEQPYNEAVDFLRQENENTRTKNLRMQKYLDKIQKKVVEYTKEQETFRNKLQEHQTENDEIKKAIKEKEKITKEEAQEYKKLQSIKEEAEKNHEKANRNFAEIQQTMQKTNKRRKQNKVQVEKLQEELEELKKVPDKNTTEIDECEKKIEKLTKQKNEIENELQKNYADLESQTKPLIEKREILETKLIDLKKDVDENKSQLTVSESELKILKHDEVTETRRYQTMKSHYEDSMENLKNQKGEIDKIKMHIPEIIKEIDSKTKQLEKIQHDENVMHSKLMTMKSEINEKLINIQSQRSNNKVLDFLMKQKMEGKIPGILGRLGNLGAIDAKYDVAISTACGRLDNIVVDTVNTAQECIEYLKKYDVGRASFIALEKVMHMKNYSGRIDTPENAPRLYDLVRVEDERVLPAFYFSLRNTLVANDLEQGTRIAYGARRYRVVTLKGDVIETSGTMSGGGRTQIRGKMGTKVKTKTSQSEDTSMLSQKAIEEMQIEAAELQEKINTIQEEQGILEKEINQLKHIKQKEENELQKLNITVKSLEEQMPRIFEQINQQQKRMEQTITDPVKLQKLETDIANKQEKLKVSEKAANEITQKIDDVKIQINDLHGSKVKTVQKKIDNIYNQIKKLENNVSKLKVDITSSERNVEKKVKQIEALKIEITNIEEEIKSLSNERTNFDLQTIEYAKAVEEADEALKKAKENASNIHEEIAALQKQESNMELKRIEIEQQCSLTEGKLNEAKSQIPYWHEQLKPLTLHEIPGDKEPVEPLKTYTEEELAAYTLQDIQYKESVQEELLKKKPNLSCIQDYIDKRDIYLERVKLLEDITTKRYEMRELYEEVRKRRYNEFMCGFHIITRKLKEMYQLITQGGDAELELVDSMDPFTEGVSFNVRPPKKTWKNISNLSGGEKTLSSLALVFALHYYKPSPLYFMDEIDAALDFKNISIVAHYIKERTKNAQFIIISLRSNMFELSNYIVGIYKVFDCTDSITIKNATIPPLTTSNQQHQSQHQNTNETNKSIVTTSINIIAIGESIRDNMENNPPLSELRDTTFAPNMESTTISQAIQNNRTCPSSININETSSSSINEDLFKKPLTPPRQL